MPQDSDLTTQTEEFEEQMRRRYGNPASGKRHSDHHGSKTNHAIQEEIIEHKIAKAQASAEDRICKVLMGFPEFQSKDLEDKYIDTYLKWLKDCFHNKKLMINPHNDIEFKFLHSSSQGGQNVNKVETAVRALHLISNIQKKNEEFSSQDENRKHAVLGLIEELKSHLIDWKEYLKDKSIDEVARYDILELIEQALLDSKK